MIDTTSVYTRGLNGAGTTDSSAASGAGATNAADMQNQFLTLLVAQLKNQDPMSPMDNAQMTSQMAQISTVTGIEKLNDTVNGVTSQFSTMQMLQGSNVIGRTVLTEGNQLGISASEGQDADGNPTTIKQGTAAFDLAGMASNVTVQITTSGGQLVDTLELGSANPGRNYFAWDASSYQGDPTDLRFKVVATNGQDAVKATTLAPQAVVATSLGEQGLMLELANGGRIPYSSVQAVF